MSESLESMVDRAPKGIEDILELLAEICLNKAMHIKENWQDEKSAGWWMLMYNRIEGMR